MKSLTNFITQNKYSNKNQKLSSMNWIPKHLSNNYWKLTRFSSAWLVYDLPAWMSSVCCWHKGHQPSGWAWWWGAGVGIPPIPASPDSWGCLHSRIHSVSVIHHFELHSCPHDHLQVIEVPWPSTNQSCLIINLKSYFYIT